MLKKISSILLILIFTISNCKQLTTQPDDSQSLLPSALLFLRNSNQITISGQAVKGIIRNGIVQISPVNNQGVCDKGNILATENTNALGVYNLRYTKTGRSVCVIVSGNSSGTSTMYDEKTLSEIAVPSNFEITNIISESTIKNQDKKNTIVSLFSRMVSSRLQSLQKANPNQDLNTSLRKAGKEITIRFGLNTGIGGALGRTNLTELKNLNDGAFPEYNDIAFDLNNPSSPLASKFIAISGGFSHLANRFKTGNRTRTEDIETVINAFASDFEDGAFDGQTVNGDSITLGTGTNRITFPSDPLTRILYPAIQAYFAEGGTLSVGAPLPSGTRPPTLTTAQLGTVQFVDSATIVVQAPPSSPGSPTSPGTPGSAPPVEPPVFSPAPGNYTTAQPNITITTATAGATIYYTTDGSTPTTASTLYTTGLGHIWGIAGRTLKAIAVKSGSSDSPIVIAEYSYPPLKTGDTNPYGAGSDGATLRGIARSYTNNGDGTVTDNATGLLWQRCSGGFTDPIGCTTGSANQNTWANQGSYCNGLTLAGKTWRLPSIDELNTLPHFGVSQPRIDSIFPNTYIAGGYYWSSTIGPSMNVWGVGFADGNDAFSGGSGSSSSVRCVSGVAQTSFVKFVDNGNGTILDKQTGLTWQKCNYGRSDTLCSTGSDLSFNFSSALNYCNTLSLAGRTWRLPNINELKTIVDKTTSIDATFFPAGAGGTYSSSTTSFSSNTSAWSVIFSGGGATSQPAKTSPLLVRCVSGP